MSQPTDPNVYISLQKGSNLPPDLPPIDRYGSLLPQLLSNPRKCSAGAGINWISQAFAIFKKNFLLWIGMALTFLVIIGLGGQLPIVGLFVSLLSMVFIGGMIKGCAAQAQGNELRFDHLFSAFNSHFLPLIKMILLYIVGLIVVMIPMFITLGMTGMLSDIDGQGLAGISAFIIILVTLFTCILIIPLVMALWFAPSLIVLHDIKPLMAMKMSFRAGLANIIPIIIFGLILSLAVPLLVVVTLGLGMLIVVPVLVITYYTSYRDVWTDQPLS